MLYSFLSTKSPNETGETKYNYLEKELMQKIQAFRLCDPKCDLIGIWFEPIIDQLQEVSELGSVFSCE